MQEKGGAIGVLGGMGPEASEYMYRTLIRLAISDFHADSNDKFPEVILYSIPVPDFIHDDRQREAVKLMLVDRVRRLNKLELCCLSIACNTVHVLLPDLQAVSRTPFISMIQSVAEEVARNGKRKVMILATPSTLRYQLYEEALFDRGVEAVVPSPEQIQGLEQIIRSVIAGNDGSRERELVVDIADSLLLKGAEGVILGCTELPLVFPRDYRVPVYNSLVILARRLLERYYAFDSTVQQEVAE